MWKRSDLRIEFLQQFGATLNRIYSIPPSTEKLHVKWFEQQECSCSCCQFYHKYFTIENYDSRPVILAITWSLRHQGKAIIILATASTTLQHFIVSFTVDGNLSALSCLHCSEPFDLTSKAKGMGPMTKQGNHFVSSIRSRTLKDHSRQTHSDTFC